jgi:hypothetical protein
MARRRGDGPPLSVELLAVIRDHLGMRVTAVHPRAARRIFARGADVRRCDGSCCKRGSVASVRERDLILSHAALIAPHMTSSARDRTQRWFERRVADNPDYVCGKSVATRVTDGACVFLRSDKLCALQVAAESARMPSFALKPSMCLLWPIHVQDGQVDVGHAWFTRRKACCAPVRAGARTIAEVMSPDVELIRLIARPKHSRGGAGS